MEWDDEGVIVSVRRHGETSAIVQALTAAHGRHAGLVRGGSLPRMAPVLQVGSQVGLVWRARLEEHLGTFRVEPLRARCRILSDRLALSALGSVAALVGFAFPERMPFPRLYRTTVDLLDRMESGADWEAGYALWERQLLDDLGFGLDLRTCAATGSSKDLVYVSPRTGRAVSGTGGAAYASRLLPLPPMFLETNRGAAAVGGSNRGEILDALGITGHFLDRWLAPALGDSPIPDARGRFVERYRRHATRLETEASERNEAGSDEGRSGLSREEDAAR